MIIRLTFVDNDFTYYLEKFCEGLRDKMFRFEEEYPIISKFSSPNEYLEAYENYLIAKKDSDAKRSKLMNPENRFSKESEEYNKICNEVKRLWNKFTKETEEINIHDYTPYVSIQYSLDEKWENREVVYYFTPYDKYITQ